MNSAQYLNQIADDNKKSSKAPSSPSLLDNKIFRIVIAAVLALTLGLFAASFFKGRTNAETSSLYRLNSRTNSLISAIETYNPSVKSSSLRSYGLSLSSALEALNASLADIYSSKNISEKSTPQSIASEETALSDALDASLKNGKLNGILDRTYAREIAYQISSLITLEESLKSKTKDPSLSSALDSSLKNLTKLHSSFDNFSEAK